MAKVYVLTEGCYSDYRIIGVFSTREKAKSAMEALNEGDEISEFLFDTVPVLSKLERGLKLYDVNYSVSDGVEILTRNPDTHETEDYMFRKYGGCYGAVWAKDEEAAIKKTREIHRVMTVNGFTYWNPKIGEVE